MHCVMRKLWLVLPANKSPSPRSQLQQMFISSVLAKSSRRSFIRTSRFLHKQQGLFAPASQSVLLSSSHLLPSTPTRYSRRTMASDSDYMAFLDKANKQRDAGSNQVPTEQQNPRQLRTETLHSGAHVPDALKSIDTFYVSDTDEPFEPVVLIWEGASKGKWPSNDEFASLIVGSQSDVPGSIETLSEKSFDPRNQYSSVIKAVRAAAAASDSGADEGKVDVKIYRVEIDHSRVEYWVVALDAVGGKIVGLRAKAVES